MGLPEVHERSLRKSSLLSSYQMVKAIPPQEVIQVLNETKISFVLVGAYGLAGWTKEARATEDVDVVVAAKQVKKAAKVLCEVFSHLEAVDLPVVVRLRDRESHEVAIDVMKPSQQPYREVFRHTHPVSASGQTYRVPSLEMAIVMKFAAMTSLYRAEEDKHQDAHDFIRIVKQNAKFDQEKLAELGSLLYADGGKDVLELVRKAQAGEKLDL
jgi:Nucleotidyl transferase AbiEii toxin, Type IV TA system